MFKTTHKNDSPAVHGSSWGAMKARARGLYSEVELQALLKAGGIHLSRAEVREHVTGTSRFSEWHHVKHNGRVVDMYFAEYPEPDKLDEIREYCAERNAERALRRQKCPACGHKKEVKTHCFHCGLSF